MMNDMIKTANIQLKVINERVKELNQELREFAILEVEATTPRDKIKWALRVAETKELLQINNRGIKVIDEIMKLESKIENMDDPMDIIDILSDISDIVNNA